MSQFATISDNDKSNELLNSNKRPQPSFSLKASMLRPSAFGSSTKSPAKSILRPSSFQLGSGGSQAKSSDTEATENEASPVPTTTSSSPSVEKVDKEPDTTENEVADSTTGSSIKPFVAAAPKEDGHEDVSEANSESKPGSQVTSPAAPSLLGQNMFVPKAGSLFAATKSTSIPIGNNNESNIGFVFGQNIHERTAGAPEQSATNNEDSKSDSTGSGELFAAAANHVSSSSSSAPIGTEGSSDATATASASQSEPKESSTVENLTKVAQAYEESRGQNKRKYDEVQTFTGEEEEINVLDVNCKLFAFVASNWEERGPGSLRLNDPRTVSGNNNSASSPKSKCSRVVFRTSGNLRVLMNTKVWPGMVVEKSSQKSLRLTAIDSSDGQIKIFLAMARPDDITSFHSALKKRIGLEKERAQSQTDDSDEPTPPSQATDEEPSTKKEKKE